MKMLAVPLAAIALASFVARPAAAQPKPDGHDVFDARVVAVGPAAGFLCGGAMATQKVSIVVTRAVTGRLKAGDRVDVPVLTCFGGPLLVKIPGAKAPVFQLDASLVHAGTMLRFDADRRHGWLLATTDRMTVLSP